MKGACIVEQSTVPQLADTARGKVWTLRTDAANAAKLEACTTWPTCATREGVELRLITADPPAGAVPAAHPGGRVSRVRRGGEGTMTLVWWELKKILRRRLTKVLLGLPGAGGGGSSGFANLGFGEDVKAPTWEGAPALCRLPGTLPPGMVR